MTGYTAASGFPTIPVTAYGPQLTKAFTLSIALPFHK
ncbi:hypothetical protein L917_07075 [Phytophthora nicotianae]|uniref:Uncharacterized protein n=1 Tax=Phytophthora nicotianae TaxID=4792 RepID=W2LEI2_PHYNI|nr:hypothetical protein L917_07075 [Phytophthora nicotianae]